MPGSSDRSIPYGSGIELRAGAAEVYSGLQPDYRRTLVAPQDDMWAAFADAAEPHEIRIKGETVGCGSVNEARELLFLHLRAEAEGSGAAILGELAERLELAAALPSTVDPRFLCWSLDAGGRAVAKALLYAHLLEPEGSALSGLRPASTEDHAAATAFVETAIGQPRVFLEPYLAERIERGELLLHEQRGEIVATGECRSDRRQPGFAHLGLIVAESRRGEGLGGRLMHALVLEARRRGLEPLCSTEPGNRAARRLIERAGFRARHRVYRVELKR